MSSFERSTVPDRITCMIVDEQVNTCFAEAVCFAEALNYPALHLTIALLTQQRVLRSRQGAGCDISGHASRCTPRVLARVPLGQNDRGEGKASNLQTSGYGPCCCLPAAWAGSVGCNDVDAAAGSVRRWRRVLRTTTSANQKGAFAEDR